MKTEITAALRIIGNGARTIRSTGNRYAADRSGKIWSITHSGSIRRNPLCRSTFKTKNGYEAVTIHFPSERRAPSLVHRLVAECFLRLDEFPSHSVHHKNGNRTDNRSANLKLIPLADNVALANRGRVKKNQVFYKELAALPKMSIVWSEV